MLDMHPFFQNITFIYENEKRKINVMEFQHYPIMYHITLKKSHELLHIFQIPNIYCVFSKLFN